MPRFSIAKLMALIGIVALDLAAGRALLVLHEEMLTGIALAVLSFQFGFVCLIRRPGRGRAFWAGFIVCGLPVMLTFVWAMLNPGGTAISTTGAVIPVPGSALFSLWSGYTEFAFDRIDPLLIETRLDPESAVLPIAALVWSLPQLLFALVGGLLTWWVARTKRPCPDAAGMAR